MNAIDIVCVATVLGLIWNFQIAPGIVNIVAAGRGQCRHCGRMS